MARKLEDEVCAAFAEGKPAHAARQKKTMWTDGVRIYSYAMPIAWWIHSGGSTDVPVAAPTPCEHADCARDPALRAACGASVRIYIVPEAYKRSRTTSSHARAVASNFRDRLLSAT